MTPADRQALRERARLASPWDVPLAQTEVVELLNAADRLAAIEASTITPEAINDALHRLEPISPSDAIVSGPASTPPVERCGLVLDYDDSIGGEGEITCGAPLIGWFVAGGPYPERLMCSAGHNWTACACSDSACPGRRPLNDNTAPTPGVRP